MLISKKKDDLLNNIFKYKKRINDIDSKIALYLSDKSKYPHPGHESFINEVRRFENRIHAYPDKDVQYFLENLMESLRIHEKIWRQKFKNFENKRKNLFKEKDIKQIYDSYITALKKKGSDENLSYNNFKKRFNKAVEIKSESIKPDETLKAECLDNGEIFIKKEKIEHN